MLAARYIPLILKQALRHRTRSLLTVAGVTVAMFLFSAVQAMQGGVRAATVRNATDTTLVVYRKDRYCPYSSRLPQGYAERIARLPGVAGVVPIKITVSNCRTSLDVVAFRGVPQAHFVETYGRSLVFIAGGLAEWERRSDAALLGQTLAQRRRLKVGDRFEAAGVNVYVAGIFRSEEVQQQNVAYTHLDFLQYAGGGRAGGYVTQLNVKVADPGRLEAVAAAIDAEFAADPDPTQTSPEKAFVAQAAADVVEIVGFAGWLGWGCLLAVLALVGNAIVLAVQDRIREHAVLQTLGYPGHLITRLIVGEGLLLSLLGGSLGGGVAAGVLTWGSFALTVEGLSVPVVAGAGVFLASLVIAGALGVVAGLVPAWQAGRREIVTCFRAG